MLQRRAELHLQYCSFNLDASYFYLLPINEEDELVRPGPEPGRGIGHGLVHLPQVPGLLHPPNCILLE